MSRRTKAPEALRERPRNAVALRYDGDGAPQVVAKGRGEVAERILTVARECEIPLHEDRELVELLAQIELGEQIPEALYFAVAEVLAFAYRLSGKLPEGFNDAPRTR